MVGMSPETRKTLDREIGTPTVRLLACCDFDYLDEGGWTLTARKGDRVTVSKAMLITLIAIELDMPYPTLPFSVVNMGLKARLAPILRRAFA